MMGLSGICTVTWPRENSRYGARTRSSAGFVAKGPGRLYIPPAMADAGTGGPGGENRRPLGVALVGGGAEFALVTAVGAFAGLWLDRRLGTGPWLVIVGTFAGAGAGFYRLVRALTRGSGESRGRPRAPGGKRGGG
jgi:hypothetical protein